MKALQMLYLMFAWIVAGVSLLPLKPEVLSVTAGILSVFLVLNFICLLLKERR